MRRILERVAACRGVDLEVWESALRVAVLAAGAEVLTSLIQGIGSGKGCGEVRCLCGKIGRAHV